jgi:hypothetical protein
MARAPAPLWKRRKEPIVDDYIHASINATNGVFDPETGHYGKLVYTGIETPERAREISSALHRCAYYLYSHKGPKVGISAKIRSEKDGTFSVEFVAINKQHTYKYMIERYGEDRSRWPYNPRSKD